MSTAPSTVTNAYDAAAADYDAGMENPLWRINEHVTWASIQGLMPPPGGTVLDAGCGSGLYAQGFLARGHPTTLLDPSPAMLALAREKIAAQGNAGLARFVRGGLERMGFADASFDLVFSEGDPLCYCGAERAQAAREMLRVLKPGGAVYASVDNRWLATLGFLAQSRPDDAFLAATQGRGEDPYGLSLHAFAAAELRDLFVAAGATDVRVSGKVVLSHLLPAKALEGLRASPRDWARLLALETQLARDVTLAGHAGHLHLSARRPLEERP